MIINFEDSLREHINKKIDTYISQGKKEREIESLLQKDYFIWVNIKQEILGGLSPFEFFESIDSPQELINMGKEYIEKYDSVPELLVERMLALRDLALPLLVSELKNYTALDELFIIEVLYMMEQIDTDAANEQLYDIMLNCSYESVRFCAQRALIAQGEKAFKLAKEVLASANNEQTKMLIDILVYKKDDIDVYNMIKKLFINDDNIALYAAYIGSYGNEDAIDLLLTKVDDEYITYNEYLEIRNALETLGHFLENEREFPKDQLFQVRDND